MMHIDGLAPLQNWMDKINDYFAKGETTKGYLATLALPFFEALGCMCMMRKLCFRLSRDQDEAQMQLLYKTAQLAFNIIQAPLSGLINPKTTYQQHVEQKLIVNSFPQATEKKQEVLIQIQTEEEELIENETSGVEPQPEKPVEAPVPPPAKKKRRHIHSILAGFEKAPDSLRKRAAAQQIMQQKAKESARYYKTVPRATILPGKIHGEEKIPEPINELSNLERLLKESPTCEKKLAGIAKETSASKNEKSLAHFGPLIEKMITKQGSWKVEKNQVHFHEAQTSYLDPKIIDVIAAAKDKGLFSELNYDQTYMLYQNLLIIDSRLETKKKSHMSKLKSVIETLQSQLKSSWVKEDYVFGNLHENCVKLLQKLQDLIEQNHGQPNKENLGLFFTSNISQDLIQSCCEWQYANFAQKSKKKSPLQLTIYDYYEILKVYFTELPSDLRSKWESLKGVSSKEEFLATMKSLPPEDQKVLIRLLRFLSVAFTKLWEPHQSQGLSREDALHSMLKEAKDILLWICPNPEQGQFGVLPEIILHFDNIFQ